MTIPDATKTETGHTPGTWRAHDVDGRGYYMENADGPNIHLTHAHCKACAYVTVLQEHGGDVDLRGLHRYGKCFGFLRMIVRLVRRGEVADPSPATAERGERR